jgi:aquaporin Z
MYRSAFAAEFLGTFVLVLGGCGSAILAGDHIGFLGIAFAFGLSLLAMVYAIGHISGCHVNPAVSLGATLAGRLTWRECGGYVVAQVLGAIVASWVLYFVATSHAGADPIAAGFAANGYGAHSPGGFDARGAFVLEVVLTFVLVFTVLATTDPRAPVELAGVAIGLVLTLIHLVGIPVTNTSVNPARSTGPATVVGGWALAQLWMFWVAPLLGGAIAAGVYRSLEGVPAERLTVTEVDEIVIRERERERERRVADPT